MGNGEVSGCWGMNDLDDLQESKIASLSAMRRLWKESKYQKALQNSLLIQKNVVRKECEMVKIWRKKKIVSVMRRSTTDIISSKNRPSARKRNMNVEMREKIDR